MQRKKSLHRLTTLESEKISKRNAYEESERVKAMGQESDKAAAKWVSEDFREKEKVDSEEKASAYMFLEDLTHNRQRYNEFLLKLFWRFLMDEDIDKKYKVRAQATKIGVIVNLGKFQAAFKASGIPKYDFYAAKMLAVKTGNTVAKLDGYVRSTESGVFVPDSFDVKRFTKPTASS